MYKILLNNNNTKYNVKFLKNSLLFEDAKTKEKSKIDYENIIDYNSVETSKWKNRVEWFMLLSLTIFLFIANLNFFIKIILLGIFGYIIYVKFLGDRIQLQITYNDVDENAKGLSKAVQERFKPSTFFIITYNDKKFVDEIKKRFPLRKRMRNKMKQFLF